MFLSLVQIQTESGNVLPLVHWDGDDPLEKKIFLSSEVGTMTVEKLEPCFGYMMFLLQHEHAHIRVVQLVKFSCGIECVYLNSSPCCLYFLNLTRAMCPLIIRCLILLDC